MYKISRLKLLPLSAAVMLIGDAPAIGAEESQQPEVKVLNITSYGYAYDLAESGETIDFGKVDLKKTVEKTYYLQLSNALPNQVTVTSTKGEMFDPVVSTTPSEKTDANKNPYYELTVAAHSGNEEGVFEGNITVSVAGGNSLTFKTGITVMNLSQSSISTFKETALEVGWNAEVNYTGDAVIKNVEYTLNPNTGKKASMKVFISDNTGDICLEIPKYDAQVQSGRHITFASHTSSRDLDNASWPCISYTLGEDAWTYPEWSRLEGAPVKADAGKYVSVGGCVFKSETTRQNPNDKYYMTFTKGDTEVKCVVPDALNNYTDGLPEGYKTGEVEIIGSVVLDVVDYNIGNETFLIPKYIRKSVPAKSLETGEWQLEAYNLTADRKDIWKAKINATDDPFVYEIEKLIDNKDGKIRMILSPEGDAIDIITGDAFQYSESYLQTWTDGDEEGTRLLMGRGAPIRLLAGNDGKVTNPDYFGYTYNNVEYVWDKASTWTKSETPSFTVNDCTPWGALQPVEAGHEFSIRRTCIGKSYTNSRYRVILDDGTEPSDIRFVVEHPEYFSVGLSEAKENNGTYYDLLLTLLPQSESGTYESSFTVSDKTGTSRDYIVRAEVLDLRCATIKEFKEKAVTMTLNDEIVYTGHAHVNAINRNVGSEIYVSDETGAIRLTCMAGTGEDIEQGMYISFSGSPTHVSGNPEEDVDYPNWKCISVECSMDIYPTWSYPERVTLESQPTLSDCGKYVSVKNVTFKSESIDYLQGMFASEDGTHLLWYEFEDENGNIYKVHPEGGAKNRYGFGIPEEYKDTENPVKLEIVGYCYGTSRSNGYPEPYINPQYIRPVEPTNPLLEGEWQMNAYSIMYDTQEKPWIVTVKQDPENPYMYEFEDFVYGNGHSHSSDTHCVVRGELDDTCNELHLISGTPFDLETYNKEVECWFALVKDFDRTGATPEQDPLPRGCEAACKRDGNTITIPVGFSYTVYGNIWTDPSHPYWPSRWSHYGIWKEDATLSAMVPYPVPENLTATVDGTDVVLKWDPVVTMEYDLRGYAVYYNDNFVDKTSADVTTYTVGNVRGTARFKVTALFGDKEEESKPSNEAQVSVVGIEETVNTEVIVKGLQGAIAIEACGEHAIVSTASGISVYDGVVNGAERISVAPGIYLVNIEGKVYKIMVK